MTEEEKKQAELDAKGVPFENRLKEMERKLQDKYDRELAATRQEMQEIRSARTVVPAAITPDPKEKLMHFVTDPDAYVQEKIQAWENTKREQALKQEMSQVRPWLQSQKGYDPEKDNPKLMEIENKYQLGHQSPLQRAQAAWDLMQRERMYDKYNSMSDDQRREASLNTGQGEGAGKATPKQQPVTRQDLIRKLQAAEAKGDLDAAIQITSLLEDVR